MSVWTHWNSGARRCSMFFSEPVSRLSTQTTRLPRSSRCSQRCEPRKPAPPVTRQVGIRWSVPTARSLADGELAIEPREREQPRDRLARADERHVEATLARAVVQRDESLKAGRVHEDDVAEVDLCVLPLGRR